MEEPTLVESKRQKKIPPPRPPPPTSLKKAMSPPADPIPRSHTVSGDIPRRPKQPPAYPAQRCGSPMLEKKSTGDPVPPPRRRKKQRSVFPEDNPNSDVKEGFVDTKQDSTPLADENGADREKIKEESARSLPTSTVRQSTKRKEAQKLAKVKVSGLACIPNTWQVHVVAMYY